MAKEIMDITCTICKKGDMVAMQDRLLNMHRCSRCDHAFSVIDPKDRISYTEDYYESHSMWFDNPNYWLFSFVYMNIVKFIGKKEVSLIDVGCGNGDFLKFVRKKIPGVKLYGIDLRDNEDRDIKFVRGDFLREEYDLKFDVVSSLASIEHVDDITLFVKKLKNITRPGGIIIINTDNTGGAFYAVSRMLKRIGLRKPFYCLYEPAHLQHFTNKSLRMLLESEALEVITQKNHNYPLKAVNLPKSNMIIKLVYLLGVIVLFAIPGKHGILQTVICRKNNR